MKNLKSHFRFNARERSGIFFLLLIITSLQVGHYFYSNVSYQASRNTLAVDIVEQSQIDALKNAALRKDSVQIHPFNPNFITDYKGYVLGMSKDEIDRLHAFRQRDKFANSPEEFQGVTLVSDSLLDALSPHFKFPEWTQKKSGRVSGPSRQFSENGARISARDHRSGSKNNNKGMEGERTDGISDLNTATALELRTVNGIGEKLSTRIVKFRDRLGGFLADEQLYDVYGLEPEVVERALLRFKVLQKPDIQKININGASAGEIAELVYIQAHIAERIVQYRELHGGIVSFDELANIEGFPSDKIARIALYLSL